MNLQDTIRAFIRMELSSDNLIAILSDLCEEQKYIVPMEDWLILYEKMSQSDMTVDQFFNLFLEAYFTLTENSNIYIFPDTESEIDSLRACEFFIDDMNILLSWDFYDEYQGIHLKEALAEYDFIRESYECCKYNLGNHLPHTGSRHQQSRII